MAPGADHGLVRVVVGRWSAWLVLIVAVVSSGMVLALTGEIETDDGPTAGLPDNAQSTEVAALQRDLPSGALNPALVVYSRDAGPLTEQDLAAVRAQEPALQEIALGNRVSPPQPSPDGTVATLVVPLSAAADNEQIKDAVADIRATVRQGLPPGVTAQVTGGAGFTADIASAFDGADVTLLAVTASVVAILLLITYRSPILWLVPLTVVALADQVAGGLLALLSRSTDLVFNGQVTGIVEVLVFGAGTDYALLLIARYREELRRSPDRRLAMARALRSAGPAILASGVTVILALLTLVFAVLGVDRATGVAGAVGLATALLFGLVVLPAALVVCPRGVFWPLVPRADADGEKANASEGRVWRRIGDATARRPWRVVVGSLLVLGALAAGLATTSLGLSKSETFRTEAESVAGLETLSRALPAGAAEPTAVLTRPETAAAVRDAAAGVPGVASAEIGESNGTITQVDVVLDAAPNTSASYAAIEKLRDAVARPDPDALVGGSVATDLDARNAALRDLTLIAPLILLVVFVVLIVLLRSVVAPIVLLGTVVLSFFAALGGASLAFTTLFDYPALDNQVPLLSFLFLVALGVDYNIFLVTRAREQSRRVGTRRGIVDALAVTGGVITSAGILLAAVFAVLGVLPVIVLTQIGVVVGLGVLLDTLLVRTVLVPAIVHLLGDRFWAPGRLDRRREAEPDRQPAAAVG